MKRKELVCVLRDYAKMTEEPPTGRAIEGQEEIMRRAADMIENSVEIDSALEIIDKESRYISSKEAYRNAACQDYWRSITSIRRAIEELRGNNKQ